MMERVQEFAQTAVDHAMPIVAAVSKLVMQGLLVAAGFVFLGMFVFKIILYLFPSGEGRPSGDDGDAGQ